MALGERWNNELERLVAARGSEVVREWYSGVKGLKKQKPRTGEEIFLSTPQLDAMVTVLQDRPTAKPQSIAAYARDMAIILRALGNPYTATKTDVERTLRLSVARKRVALLRALLLVAGRPELLPRRVTIRERRKLREDQVLNTDDVNALIRAAPSLRDRALIAVLWETGARIHEVLALRLSDVYEAPGNGGRYLKVFFHKTKVVGEEHSSLLVEATSFLRAWLGAYPFPKEKDAPLFASIDKRNYGEALTYNGVYFMLKTVSARANIAKPVNPHAFRHGQVTFLLRAGLSDAMVKKVVGFAPGSNVMTRYAHLVPHDADNAKLQALGKAPLEAIQPESLFQPEEELVPAVPVVDNRPRPAGTGVPVTVPEVERRFAELKEWETSQLAGVNKTIEGLLGLLKTPEVVKALASRPDLASKLEEVRAEAKQNGETSIHQI